MLFYCFNVFCLTPGPSWKTVLVTEIVPQAKQDLIKKNKTVQKSMPAQTSPGLQGLRLALVMSREQWRKVSYWTFGV